MSSQELKTEIRRLRYQRFYYVSRKIPKDMWRDRDGIFHDMNFMTLDHISACIRLINKDILTLKSPLVSPEASEKLEKKAKSKLEELKNMLTNKLAG